MDTPEDEFFVPKSAHGDFKKISFDELKFMRSALFMVYEKFETHSPIDRFPLLMYDATTKATRMLMLSSSLEPVMSKLIKVRLNIQDDNDIKLVKNHQSKDVIRY